MGVIMCDMHVSSQPISQQSPDVILRPISNQYFVGALLSNGSASMLRIGVYKGPVHGHNMEHTGLVEEVLIKVAEDNLRRGVKHMLTVVEEIPNSGRGGGSNTNSRRGG